MTIVDTHAHLDADAFDEDRDEVIARAVEAGVSTIINVGVNLESSERAVSLAEEHPEVLAAAGFHPHQADTMKKADVGRIGEIARHPRVVAIGEIGLDFYRNYSPREVQFQALKWQLELASELELPVVIHARQAEKEMLEVLRDWTGRSATIKGRSPGVIHCFSGDTATAEQYLEMGFYLALGAYIGYPTSVWAYDVIRSIPQDRLMVETDCPFLAPQSLRGKRNEPAYLQQTVELLAEIRGATVEAVARETTENAKQLFGWK